MWWAHCRYRFTDNICQHGPSPNGTITLVAFKKENRHRPFTFKPYEKGPEGDCMAAAFRMR